MFSNYLILKGTKWLIGKSLPNCFLPRLIRHPFLAARHNAKNRSFHSRLRNTARLSAGSLNGGDKARGAAEKRLGARDIAQDLGAQGRGRGERALVPEAAQKLDVDAFRRRADERIEYKSFHGQVASAERGAEADVGN